jgi:hypothetical protein
MYPGQATIATSPSLAPVAGASVAGASVAGAPHAEIKTPTIAITDNNANHFDFIILSPWEFLVGRKNKLLGQILALEKDHLLYDIEL